MSITDLILTIVYASFRKLLILSTLSECEIVGGASWPFNSSLSSGVRSAMSIFGSCRLWRR